MGAVHQNDGFRTHPMSAGQIQVPGIGGWKLRLETCLSEGPRVGRSPALEKDPKIMMKKIWITLAVFGLTGCAAIQIPPDRLERSEASIRAAEELGAPAVPAAKLHLQLAKDQTELAKKMAADGDDRAVLV